EAIDLQRLFREMLDGGDDACVMEATSIAQVEGRLAGTHFAVLVFTNLTQDHLDYHGSMDAYFEAKRALFAQADAAVVNVADEHTPDSLANVIRAARALGDRLFVVFGAGGDRDRAKRPLMGRVVAQLADCAILTSDNPRREAPHVIAEEVAGGAPGEF